MTACHNAAATSSSSTSSASSTRRKIALVVLLLFMPSTTVAWTSILGTAMTRTSCHPTTTSTAAAVAAAVGRTRTQKVTIGRTRTQKVTTALSLSKKKSQPSQSKQKDNNDTMVVRQILRGTLAVAASLMIWMGSGLSMDSNNNNMARAMEEDSITTMTPTTVTTSTTSSTSTSTPPPPPYGKRYWMIMNNDQRDSVRESSGEDEAAAAAVVVRDPLVLAEQRRYANNALVDYAVGEIIRQYYDNSGGAYFDPHEFTKQWFQLRKAISSSGSSSGSNPLETREGTVEILQHLVQTLHDPYSKYLTREELKYELDTHQQYGFLGLGVMVEVPQQHSDARSTTKPMMADIHPHTTTPYYHQQQQQPQQKQKQQPHQHQYQSIPSMTKTTSTTTSSSGSSSTTTTTSSYLSITRAANLPVVTAVVPFSPAERAGLVVGDRIVAVGTNVDNFLGWNREQIARQLDSKYNAKETGARYFGQVELTVAKPVYVVPTIPRENDDVDAQQRMVQDDMASTTTTGWSSSSTWTFPREMVVAYRPTRVKLSVMSEPSSTLSMAATATATAPLAVVESSTGARGESNNNDKNLPLQASGVSMTNKDDITSPPVQQHSVVVAGGNHIVHYELLSSSSGSSILDRKAANKRQFHSQPQQSLQHDAFLTSQSGTSSNTGPLFQQQPQSQEMLAKNDDDDESKVGYIRLTRFSRASTDGFVQAVQALEEAGAQSYIIDLRNNYGGVIQEAMLTASTLLEDSHSILCFTLNARGGFTPHDVEEYVLGNARYPGYLLSGRSGGGVGGVAGVSSISTSSRSISTFGQALHSPHANTDLNGEWVPPSSYASLREQMGKRGYKRVSSSTASSFSEYSSRSPSTQAVTPPLAAVPTPRWGTFPRSMFVAHAAERGSIVSSSVLSKPEQQSILQSWLARNEQTAPPPPKKIVLLVNEGTASAAEVFASALHDNGRLVALVGTKTFGKGLIQHTFPMPDGGGLRLTVAEYLTPALRHVTKVGNAQYDPVTGEFVGGGIRPDLYCPSHHGIPVSHVGADLCVGMALDALEEAEY
jgi:C-terminal processing protease CtpA/Prc